MKKFKAMKAVYCYYFPEVRPQVAAVDQLPNKDKLFLTTTRIKEAINILQPLNFQPPLNLPVTSDGTIDLDMLHIPIIERVVQSYKQTVPNLVDFTYCYPTSGSSEGIFHYLVYLKVKGVDKIYTLEGEYEGYREQGKNIGIQTEEIDPNLVNIKRLKPGYWFISNPSARNGNILDDYFIEKLCQAGHKVVLDLAYVGSTKFKQFDVRDKNIEGVVMSFSKPYGVFRKRMGGFLFSRYPLQTLYGNKWFKDIERLLMTLKVAEEIGPNFLYERYQHLQKRIIEEINKDFNLGIKASDALLLGYLNETDFLKLNEDQKKIVTPFRRGTGYRFCLTPYYETIEGRS